MTLPRLELCAAHLLTPISQLLYVPIDSCSHDRLSTFICELKVGNPFVVANLECCPAKQGGLQSQMLLQ